MGLSEAGPTSSHPDSGLHVHDSQQPWWSVGALAACFLDLLPQAQGGPACPEPEHLCPGSAQPIASLLPLGFLEQKEMIKDRVHVLHG